jgi:hypothetical protein
LSNYTKSTNFATKDNLSPGNPLKIVKGTEIDTEFNNIQTAVATKTDNASANITGGSITGITDLAVADGGTGASTATAALNNLLPTQTGNANKYLQTDGTNATWDAVSLSTSDITGTLPVANGGTGVTSSTGTGNVVLSNSPTLVTPVLGTPASGTATNLTGLPISTGVSGLGTGVATFLGTPSSANLASAVTDETGSGALVFANSPTLVTPALGTPSALVGTNITGTASGLTAGNVTTNANLTGAVTSVGNATSLGSFSSSNLAGALTDETGSGSAVFATSPTLVTPILGTPTSATLTNATGLPISTGVSGLGTGVATFLATPSSANLLSALTDETGTGVVVFSTSPTLVTPILGTPTSATLTNATGLPLTTGVTGQLPVANGGTGTATPSIVAGTNVTVTGTWPNQTIASSGGSGGGVAYTAVKTANYTAANNDGVLTDTTSGAFTVTLPSSPSVGNIVLVIDSLSQWGTNNLTIDPTALIKIAGNTAGDTLVCDITGATVTLVYTGATYGWNVAAQVGGNGGTAVTLNGTQTLTNKTLTSPVLTAPVLGTPASGTVTNLTGTASININGTVGATTPAAGNFTTLGATGVTTLQAGTAALPALTTTGDTNTGIFFPAADTIAVSTGGTERAKITPAGYFKASNTGIYQNGVSSTHELDQTADLVALNLYATNATYSTDVFQILVSRNTTNNSFHPLIYYNLGAAEYRFKVADSGNVTNINNSYGGISDIKLKENILDATPKLEKLNQVRVVNYNFIGNEQKQLGVIAQELEQIFPSMVEESLDKDREGNDLGTTTKAVKYSVFVPILIKAIQEQQALITTLTERITALEGV